MNLAVELECMHIQLDKHEKKEEEALLIAEWLQQTDIKVETIGEHLGILDSKFDTKCSEICVSCVSSVVPHNANSICPSPSLQGVVCYAMFGAHLN